jgi:hypothetical protein
MRACPFCLGPLTWAWDPADACESPRCRRCGSVSYWLVVDTRGRIVAEGSAHRVVLAEHLLADLRALATACADARDRDDFQWSEP